MCISTGKDRYWDIFDSYFDIATGAQASHLFCDILLTAIVCQGGLRTNTNRRKKVEQKVARFLSAVGDRELELCDNDLRSKREQNYTHLDAFGKRT